MTDDWATPDWLKGCFPRFYDPFPLYGKARQGIDGMTIDWVRVVKEGDYDGLWLNGNHSDPLPWILKGIETAKSGIRVIMLTRLDCSTKYHRALVQAGFHPLGAFERIKYGNSDHGGQYANVLWFSDSKALEDAEETDR